MPATATNVAVAGLYSATSKLWFSLHSTEGRWSPNQILSHLSGPERTGHLPILRAFLDSDIRVDWWVITPQVPTTAGYCQGKSSFWDITILSGGLVYAKLMCED
jgi:hypothetical protein